MSTQHGYLVLADISGYTSYLAGTELEHAHEVLTELLETIVLLKNHVSEATGWRAYALFTEAALARIGIRPDIAPATSRPRPMAAARAWPPTSKPNCRCPRGSTAASPNRF